MKGNINRVLEQLKTKKGPTFREILAVMGEVGVRQGTELLHAYEDFLGAKATNLLNSCEGFLRADDLDPRRQAYETFNKLSFEDEGRGTISLDQYYNVWRPILTVYKQKHDL